MFATKQSSEIDEIADAIVEEGAVDRLMDEADFSVQVFSKNEIDITDIVEGSINMWTNADGQDVYVCTVHDHDASIHLFFAGEQAQIVNKLFTLHLRVVASQTEEDDQ